MVMEFRSFCGLEFGPLQANKKHSFHNWRGKERREALSISGAERSPEGRGSEHSAVLGYAPRRAAQAGLTGAVFVQNGQRYRKAKALLLPSCPRRVCQRAADASAQLRSPT